MSKDGMRRDPALVHFSVGAQDSFVYQRNLYRHRYRHEPLGSIKANTAAMTDYVSGIPHRLQVKAANGVEKLLQKRG